MESGPTVKFLKILFAWLAATVASAATGSVIQTQYNLAAIAALGAPVPLDLRLQTTWQDLGGFAPMYAAITAGAFLVAFLVAALLVRFWPRRRRILYILAGGAAIGTAIVTMNALLPVTGIGATRWTSGILALSLAGALGGWLFAALSARRRRPRFA